MTLASEQVSVASYSICPDDQTIDIVCTYFYNNSICLYTIKVFLYFELAFNMLSFHFSNYFYVLL